MAGEARLGRRQQDLERHVELDGVREEDRSGEQDDDDLGQPEETVGRTLVEQRLRQDYVSKSVTVTECPLISQELNSFVNRQQKMDIHCDYLGTGAN